jgi:aminoglycoside 3-N-acetyltransferase
VTVHLPSEIASAFAAAFGDAGVIVLHSAPRAIGSVPGGIESIGRALFAAAEGRTLVVPAFTSSRIDPSCAPDPRAPIELWDAIRDELPLYEPATSPPEAMGALATCVWRADGSVRSSHPVESVVAHGPRAASIVDPHPLDDPMGPRGPWARLHALDATIVMLGVGLERCSILHHAERMAEVPYLAPYSMPVAIDGERVWIEAEGANGCAAGFPRLKPVLTGAIAEHRVGEARVLAVRARPLVDAAVALLRRDPLALLCSNEGCAACRTAERGDSTVE